MSLQDKYNSIQDDMQSRELLNQFKAKFVLGEQNRSVSMILPTQLTHEQKHLLEEGIQIISPSLWLDTSQLLKSPINENDLSIWSSSYSKYGGADYSDTNKIIVKYSRELFQKLITPIGQTVMISSYAYDSDNCWFNPWKRKYKLYKPGIFNSLKSQTNAATRQFIAEMTPILREISNYLSGSQRYVVLPKFLSSAVLFDDLTLFCLGSYYFHGTYEDESILAQSIIRVNNQDSDRL